MKRTQRTQRTMQILSTGAGCGAMGTLFVLFCRNLDNLSSGEAAAVGAVITVLTLAWGMVLAGMWLPMGSVVKFLWPPSCTERLLGLADAVPADDPHRLTCKNCGGKYVRYLLPHPAGLCEYCEAAELNADPRELDDDEDRDPPTMSIEPDADAADCEECVKCGRPVVERARATKHLCRGCERDMAAQMDLDVDKIPARFGLKPGSGRPPTAQRTPFSLVEVLVVMIIMGMLLALVLPAFTHWGRGAGVDASGRQVSRALMLARQYAIAEREQIAVLFPTDTGPEELRRSGYLFCTVKRGEFVAPVPNTAAEYLLPGVTLAACAPAWQTVENVDWAKFGFTGITPCSASAVVMHPAGKLQGVSENLLLTLVAADGSERTLEIACYTGRVRWLEE